MEERALWLLSWIILPSWQHVFQCSLYYRDSSCRLYFFFSNMHNSYCWNTLLNFRELMPTFTRPMDSKKTHTPCRQLERLSCLPIKTIISYNNHKTWFSKQLRELRHHKEQAKVIWLHSAWLDRASRGPSNQSTKAGWSVIQAPTTLQLSGTQSGQSPIIIRKTLQSPHPLDWPITHTYGTSSGSPQSLHDHQPTPIPSQEYNTPSPSPSQKRTSINSSHGWIQGKPQDLMVFPQFPLSNHQCPLAFSIRLIAVCQSIHHRPSSKKGQNYVSEWLQSRCSDIRRLILSLLKPITSAQGLIKDSDDRNSQVSYKPGTDACVLHDARARKRASRIVADQSHTAHCLIRKLPSSCRFCTIRTRTTRHMNSLFFRSPSLSSATRFCLLCLFEICKPVCFVLWLIH